MQEMPQFSGGRETRMGNGKAEIVQYGILDEKQNLVTLLESGGHYTFFLRAVFYEEVDGAVAGFAIRNVKGVDLFGTTTALLNSPIVNPHKGDVLEVRLRVNMTLTNGTFFLTVALADPDAASDVQYDMRYDVLQFEVKMKTGIFTTSVVDMDPNISCHLCSVLNSAPSQRLSKTLKDPQAQDGAHNS